MPVSIAEVASTALIWNFSILPLSFHYFCVLYASWCLLCFYYFLFVLPIFYGLVTHIIDPTSLSILSA